MIFNVGDKVRALHNDWYSITTDGWIGYVTKRDGEYIWVSESKRGPYTNEINNFRVNSQFFELIEAAPVKEKEEIKVCVDAGLCDFSVSTQSTNDWYCLLRNIQGSLDALYNSPVAYMIDGSDFIKDSLFCEYAYIIDLDIKTLEFYVGFQKEPNVFNRYGTESDNGYYPCRMVSVYPIETMNEHSVEKYINDMNKVSE